MYFHHVHSIVFVLYYVHNRKSVTVYSYPKKGETMSEITAKTKYNMEYAKTKLKRIPLDVQKEKYEEIKAAAEAAGESINGYIKKAIDERMEKDGALLRSPASSDAAAVAPEQTPDAQ